MTKYENDVLSILSNMYCNDKDFQGVIDFCDRVLLHENRSPAFYSEVRAYKMYALYCIALSAMRDDKRVDLFSEKTKKKVITAIDYAFSVGEQEGYSPDIYLQIAGLFNNYGHKALDIIRHNTPTRNYAINALGVDDPDDARLAESIYNELTDQLFKDYYHAYLRDPSPDNERLKFTNLHNYDQRKYIYIARDVKHLDGTLAEETERIINHVFTLDLIPADIVFPFGRPAEGVYMAHPVKTNHYYPVRDIDETLFNEKIREFCWLVQCLGATEIVFHSNKGAKVAEEFGVAMNVGGSIGVPKAGLDVDYTRERVGTKEQFMNQSVDRVQHFHPKKKPYCPDDLIWFDSDPEWKNLVKQRMQGSILDYTYKISASQTCMMSTSEKHAVEANVEYIETKVDGHFSKQNERVFRSEDDTEWSIHIEFAPISQLTGDNLKNDEQSLTSEEQDYVKMYSMYAVDGEVSELDRTALEMYRGRLGITVERARKLEASCSKPQLTKDEKEYLGLYKKYAVSGVLSERDRTMLNMMRDRMGISEERAKEIEQY